MVDLMNSMLRCYAMGTAHFSVCPIDAGPTAGLFYSWMLMYQCIHPCAAVARANVAYSGGVKGAHMLASVVCGFFPSLDSNGLLSCFSVQHFMLILSSQILVGSEHKYCTTCKLLVDWVYMYMPRHSVGGSAFVCPPPLAPSIASAWLH